MSNYLYKSYDILGYILFIDDGRTYHVLCNRCYEKSIQDIANSENITAEHPIFVDSEDESMCEECNTIINVENE